MTTFEIHRAWILRVVWACHLSLCDISDLFSRPTETLNSTSVIFIKPFRPSRLKCINVQYKHDNRTPWPEWFFNSDTACFKLLFNLTRILFFNVFFPSKIKWFCKRKVEIVQLKFWNHLHKITSQIFILKSWIYYRNTPKEINLKRY